MRSCIFPDVTPECLGDYHNNTIFIYHFIPYVQKCFTSQTVTSQFMYKTQVKEDILNSYKSIKYFNSVFNEV